MFKSLPEHLVPQKTPVVMDSSNANEGGSKFKFIVGIQSRKKVTKIVNPWSELLWVQGQSIYVVVTLSNPLHFPIHIESISLSTEGCLFEAHSYSLVIPPLTPSLNVIISGKPLESGKLYIHGCLIRAFNILARHPVDDFGKGISM